MDDELLQQEKEDLEARIEYLDDPKKVKEDKLARIKTSLSRRKPDYTPVHKGNRTMYQHLEDLKDRWEKGGEKLARDEKKKVEARLAKTIEELTKEKR